jgi:hypothetical protein
MNKNLTLMSFTACVLVANVFNSSYAAEAKKFKAASFTFALWSDMPYAKNGDTSPSSVTAPAMDGTTDGKNVFTFEPMIVKGN